MKKNILLLIVAIFLGSCGFESKYVLPEKSFVNTELLGVWKDVNGGNGMLIFTKKTDTRYNLEVVFDVTKSGNNTTVEAYEYKIADITILNLISQDENNRQVSMFYSYRIDGDTLYYKEVSKNDITKDIHSNEDLLAYFRNNINNPDFFGKTEKMLRAK